MWKTALLLSRTVSLPIRVDRRRKAFEVAVHVDSSRRIVRNFDVLAEPLKETEIDLENSADLLRHRTRRNPETLPNQAV